MGAIGAALARRSRDVCTIEVVGRTGDRAVTQAWLVEEQAFVCAWSDAAITIDGKVRAERMAAIVEARRSGDYTLHHWLLERTWSAYYDVARWGLPRLRR